MELADALRLQRRLEEMRDEIIREGDVPVALEQDEPVASAVDEDELPYREMAQVLASNRNKERAGRILLINQALKRIQEDPEEYGNCESCDEAIPVRRLELMPFARYCVACQSRRDAKPTPHTRKKVSDFRE